MAVFEYNICTCSDETLFKSQCEAIEKNIPGISHQEILEDATGTLVQRYTHPLGQIIVKKDKDVDALYVQSDFDLLPYFQK